MVFFWCCSFVVFFIVLHVVCKFVFFSLFSIDGEKILYGKFQFKYWLYRFSEVHVWVVKECCKRLDKTG